MCSSMSPPPSPSSWLEKLLLVVVALLSERRRQVLRTSSAAAAAAVAVAGGLWTAASASAEHERRWRGSVSKRVVGDGSGSLRSWQSLLVAADAAGVVGVVVVVAVGPLKIQYMILFFFPFLDDWIVPLLFILLLPLLLLSSKCQPRITPIRRTASQKLGNLQ